MTDRELSELIASPDDALLRTVSPLRKSLLLAVTGTALTMLTFNFLALNYILPAVGILCRLLGLRSLRRENGGFAVSFLATAVTAISFYLTLFASATVWSGLLEKYALPLKIFSVVVSLVYLISLRRGFVSLREKAGFEPTCGAGTALILWYCFLCLLGFIHFTGFILPLLLFVGYCCILRSLARMCRDLDDAGYAFAPAKVRLSDRALALLLLALLLCGLILCPLLLGKYPMDFTEETPPEATAARERLLALGFPEDILRDLSDDDLVGCENALRVEVSSGLYPLNDGRRVTERDENGIRTHREYDERELCITGIAVQLDTERETWRLFHHFEFCEPVKFYGADAFELWGHQNDGWMERHNSYGGRVLYDDGGRVYASPFASLERKEYTSSIAFMSSRNNNLFAEFSFPNGKQNCRGYLCCDISECVDGYIIDSWVNFIHQKRFTFPVKTAAQARTQVGFSLSKNAFAFVQTAIQFFP